MTLVIEPSRSFLWPRFCSLLHRRAILCPVFRISNKGGGGRRRFFFGVAEKLMSARDVASLCFWLAGENSGLLAGTDHIADGGRNIDSFGAFELQGACIISR